MLNGINVIQTARALHGLDEIRRIRRSHGTRIVQNVVGVELKNRGFGNEIRALHGERVVIPRGCRFGRRWCHAFNGRGLWCFCRFWGRGLARGQHEGRRRNE